MSDQYISVLRDQIPLGPDLGSSLQVESPIVEPGLPWAAVELDTVNDHFLVLEVDAVGQELLAGFPFLLEAEIMVAGDGDLMGVGQCGQEIIELPDVIQRSMTGQVAGVDQEVSVGDGQGLVQAVGVAEGYDIHGLVN